MSEKKTEARERVSRNGKFVIISEGRPSPRVIVEAQLMLLGWTEDEIERAIEEDERINGPINGSANVPLDAEQVRSEESGRK